MKNKNQYLIIQQTDEKLKVFNELKSVVVPSHGWINTCRIALKMSLRQLGQRMNISSQSVKELEMREINDTVSLKSLKEVAQALDMQFVYGFIPKKGSLEQMIEHRANELAIEIVMRTNQTMTLEDQQNSKKRLKKAVLEKTNEIKNEMPKYLWE